MTREQTAAGAKRDSSPSYPRRAAWWRRNMRAPSRSPRAGLPNRRTARASTSGRAGRWCRGSAPSRRTGSATPSAPRPERDAFVADQLEQAGAVQLHAGQHHLGAGAGGSERNAPAVHMEQRRAEQQTNPAPISPWCRPTSAQKLCSTAERWLCSTPLGCRWCRTCSTARTRGSRRTAAMHSRLSRRQQVFVAQQVRHIDRRQRIARAQSDIAAHARQLRRELLRPVPRTSHRRTHSWLRHRR